MDKYVVYGNVPAKSNCYGTRQGKGRKIYKKKPLKEYEESMRVQIAHMPRTNGKFIFIAKVYFKTRGSDLSNFDKVFLDILQDEGKIENDNLLYDTVQSKKKDKDNPRVEFWILPAEEYDIEVRINKK